MSLGCGGHRGPKLFTNFCHQSWVALVGSGALPVLGSGNDKCLMGSSSLQVFPQTNLKFHTNRLAELRYVCETAANLWVKEVIGNVYFDN